eukprot:7363607-Pyramimonas_sp.AAC.1
MPGPSLLPRPCRGGRATPQRGPASHALNFVFDNSGWMRIPEPPVRSSKKSHLCSFSACGSPIATAFRLPAVVARVWARTDLATDQANAPIYSIAARHVPH